MTEPLAKTEEALKALKTLADSRGWAILYETMQAEIVSAAMQIAENRALTVDEINFRRGAIWAAHQLLQTPGRLLARLDAEARLHPKRDDHTKLPE